MITFGTTMSVHSRARARHRGDDGRSDACRPPAVKRRRRPAMSEWRDYSVAQGLGGFRAAGGRLLVREGVRSPQLGNERRILVYLPDDYAAGQRRYPVVYMHDGQNLFDPQTS